MYQVLALKLALVHTLTPTLTLTLALALGINLTLAAVVAAEAGAGAAAAATAAAIVAAATAAAAVEARTAAAAAAEFPLFIQSTCTTLAQLAVCLLMLVSLSDCLVISCAPRWRPSNSALISAQLSSHYNCNIQECDRTKQCRGTWSRCQASRQSNRGNCEQRHRSAKSIDPCTTCLRTRFQRPCDSRCWARCDTKAVDTQAE